MSLTASRKALIGYAVGAFAFLGLCFFLLERRPTLIVLGGSTMGTSWSLQYWSEADPLEDLETVLSAELRRLDKEVFSTYAPESELSRLNRDESHATEVSADLFTVLQLAQEVHRQSGGAFDPTVGPLVRLWGFGPDAPAPGLPDEHSLHMARAKVGMSRLQLEEEGRRVARAPGIELDLSAIAKGYAVDVLAQLLHERGIDDYLLEIGGEVRVAGYKPDGSSWRIAIERPTEVEPQAFAVIDADGAAFALAGSGDYRNYRELNGKRYSHEIDPRTGWPVAHALRAVTVVAPKAALADAWATALLVLGPEEGLRIADGLGLAAYFIIQTNQGFAAQSSQRFKERFSGLDAL